MNVGIASLAGGHSFCIRPVSNLKLSAVQLWLFDLSKSIPESKTILGCSLEAMRAGKFVAGRENRLKGCEALSRLADVRYEMRN